MFKCETVVNGVVQDGSLEEFDDSDKVLQCLSVTAAANYAVEVAFWLGGVDLQLLNSFEIANGKTEMDRWTYIP